MKIGRFLLGTGLAAGVSLAAYLTLTHQDPVALGHQVKRQAQKTAHQIGDINQARENVTTNAQKLSQAIEDGTQTLNAIQTQIDKFQFKVAPRVAAIEETLNHLEQSEF